jgi:CRP-like cAMP-binding protein
MFSVIDNNPGRMQTLTRVPLFAGLSERELAFLTQRTFPRHYDAGEMVFSEGEPCSGMYVVESGQVCIFKSSPGGTEQVLSIEGPGSSVAELSVFDGGAHPASVAAIEPATLLFVRKQDFQALCLAHPQVALKVVRVVRAPCAGWCEPLQSSRLQLFALDWCPYFCEPRKKMASARRGPRRSNCSSSNQELDSQIGTVRELVSRNLSRLQPEGIIQIDGRIALIHDLRALEPELQTAER